MDFISRRRRCEPAIISSDHVVLTDDAREPFDAEVLTKARNLACIYGDDRISLEGLADVLNGQPAVGTLPVRLDAAAAIL